MAWHRTQNNDERVLIWLITEENKCAKFFHMKYIINNDDKNNKHFGIFKESAEWPLFIEYIVRCVRKYCLFITNKVRELPFFNAGKKRVLSQRPHT